MGTLIVGILIGFAIGYGVRALISRQRRARARRGY
jgi:NhaP-type Na+/H+ or K+/H+ antiporter